MTNLEKKINESLYWTGWKESPSQYGKVGQVIFLAQLSKHHYHSGKLKDEKECCHDCWESVGYYQSVMLGRTSVAGGTFNGLDIFSTLAGVEKALTSKESIEHARVELLRGLVPMLEDGLWKQDSTGEKYRFGYWKPLIDPSMKKL